MRTRVEGPRGCLSRRCSTKAFSRNKRLYIKVCAGTRNKRGHQALRFFNPQGLKPVPLLSFVGTTEKSCPDTCLLLYVSLHCSRRRTVALRKKQLRCELIQKCLYPKIVQSAVRRDQTLAHPEASECEAGRVGTIVNEIEPRRGGTIKI